MSLSSRCMPLRWLRLLAVCFALPHSACSWCSFYFNPSRLSLQEVNLEIYFSCEKRARATRSIMSAGKTHAHTNQRSLPFPAFKRDVISNMLPPSSFVFLSRRKSASTLFFLFAFSVLLRLRLTGNTVAQHGPDFIDDSTVSTHYK